MKKFTANLVIMALIVSMTFGGLILGTEDKVYAANIDTAFPQSYKTLLESVAKGHPNWSFVAVDTGLDWNTVVSEEAKNNRSLVVKSNADILLSKESGHYNPSTGAYYPVDGSSWVRASKPAIAYYMDPRNFLNSNYIFQFEALGFNDKFHTIATVEAILEGTDLANKKIVYIDTTGNTIITTKKYSEVIYTAGKSYGVSPIHLAARIKQETSASLKNNSISGTFSYNGVSYRGYYNFYNIGAYATSTGSAVANGLNYAKSQGWNTPEKAILGGAKYIASQYISRGQNTGYFQKFNVISSPYYGHQYMQNLTAAVTEGYQTYKAYTDMNIVDKGHVFYIPVYKNMPSHTSSVKISKNVKTATMSGSTNMRKGPSTSYDKVVSVPAGATVSVEEVVYMDSNASVANRLAYPYWCKVIYGNYIGYVIMNNIVAKPDFTVNVGATKQLSVTKVGSEKVYYETSNPLVATVNSSGVITGKKAGTCQIYAINSAGTRLDMVGVKVEQVLAEPKLTSIQNVIGGVKVSWDKVAGATYYRVYRKEEGGTFARIVDSVKTTNYTDTTAVSGKKYIYTVRAGDATHLGEAYNQAGISITYITTPKLDSITAGAEDVTVKWTMVNEAEGYYVYRKQADTSWSLVATIKDKNTASYKDTELNKGTKYTYTVRAFKSGDRSWYYSDGISTMFDGLIAPKLKVISNEIEGIKVTWEAVTGATYYRVYRKESGGSYKAICSETSDTSYVDKEAEAGKTYIYTVRPGTKELLGAQYVSEGISLKRITTPKLEKISAKDTQITITFSKVSEAKGYYVYRKVNGVWKRIANIDSNNVVIYTDEKLAEGTEYVYTVRAYDDNCTSSYDKEGIKATTLPKKTTITSLSNSATGVKIAWTSVINSDGYALYRKDEGGSYKRIKTITDYKTSSFIDTTVISGKSYIYTIRTIKGDKLAYYDAAGTKVMYLARPTINITAVSQSGVKMSWTKITGAKGYYLYRKNSLGKWARIATITSGSTINYTDTGLKPATNYTYTVRAYNGTYVSAFIANGVTGKTLVAYDKYITLASVNYRSGPGTSYSVKGALAKGKTILVERGYYKRANGLIWYRFKLNNQNYYVASKYLKKRN